MNNSIPRDSALGDFLNALLLRDPYREPVAVPAEESQEPAEPQQTAESIRIEEINKAQAKLVDAAGQAILAAQAITSALAAVEQEEAGQFEIHVSGDLPSEPSGVSSARVTEILPATELGKNRLRQEFTIETDDLPPLSTGDRLDIQYSPQELSVPSSDRSTAQLTPHGQEINYGRILTPHPVTGRLVPIKPSAFAPKVILDATEAQIARLIVGGKSNRRIAKEMKRPFGYTLKRLLVLRLKFDATSRQDLKAKISRKQWTTTDEITETLVNLKRTGHKGLYVIANPRGGGRAFKNFGGTRRTTVLYTKDDALDSASTADEGMKQETTNQRATER